MQIKKIFSVMACLLVCNLLAAMEWPLPDAKMIRNFGFNDRGKPVLGTVFEGEGEILCAERGELLFSHNGKNNASRLPSPLGAWTAIDHGDGLVSIYSRYRDNGRPGNPPPLPPGLARGASIAAAGSSGWSSRNGLYFLLFDRKERRWVNASMVISAFADTVPPQILGIQLRKAGNKDSRAVEGGVLRGIGQGRYSIMINTVDTLIDPRETPLIPHRIVCSVNGEEAGALSFETICARDGVLMVNRNGLMPASRVYASWPAFEAGEVHLNRGQAILEVIVQDISGNTRSVSTRILVE